MCGKTARRDLRGGRQATDVPTLIDKKLQHQTNMKLIPTLLITSALLTTTIYSSENQNDVPSFIQIGKTYEAAIGMISINFEVIKIEGNWIKVRQIEKKSKKPDPKVMWLNLRELPIIMELGQDAKSGEKGASDK